VVQETVNDQESRRLGGIRGSKLPISSTSTVTHILDVLSGVMELARQERSLLEAHAVIEQLFEPTFP
jgi:hypothetical protein